LVPVLSYSLLKNHAGILLVGDYTSLTWLHEIVHDVNERSPIVKDKEGSFLGLAYDVREAYEPLLIKRVEWTKLPVGLTSVG
jgi:hypothetical protein